MAKVQQDPNEVVGSEEIVTVPLTEEKADTSVFVTRNGIRIKLHPVDPMTLKKAQDSVKTPKRPTYMAVTASGKKEEFPLDEVSAEQVPNGRQRWLAYMEDRIEAMGQKNDNLVRTIFYYGTELPDGMPMDWVEEQAALGMELPSHTNPKIQEGLLRAHYLATHLNKTDLGNLIQAIMRQSGVSEEDIQEAEDSFRGEVRNG